LHEALTNHPELLPAEDIGLGRVVVIGRESTLASGDADLILLDDRGQVCVVEVKKEGNPDARHVVAQLLDYAAALWGKTLAEFEQDVFLPYARKRTWDVAAPTSLHEFLVAEFGDGIEEESSGVEPTASSVEEIESNLSESLRSGRFVLVLAAPVIPEKVRRVLDYMNAQGHRLYGLEVSYFRLPGEKVPEATECFVPRLAVQPTPGGTPPPPPGIWNEERILQQLQRQNDGQAKTEVAEAIFNWANGLGLQRWYGAGRVEGTCFFGRVDEQGSLRPLVLIAYPASGAIVIAFGEMASGRHPAFQPEGKRRELQRRLNEISGISITDEKLDKLPSIALLVLTDPAVRDRFLAVMKWALDQMEQPEVA